MIISFTKNFVRRFGIDVYRFYSNTNPTYRLAKGLEYFEIDLVFDIGANTGQFALELRSVKYKERIVSFEPLVDAYNSLITASIRDPKWHIHPRTAIGDFEGEIQINIAGNSASSSVLPMLNSHRLAAPNSAYIGSVNSPISCLDNLAPEYIEKGSKNYFIKIDTQGYEWKVLNGALKTLEFARGIMCELSFVQLYEGQYLWTDVLERLESYGFTLWSLQPIFIDNKSGRVLQADGIFFKLEDLMTKQNSEL